MVTQVGQISNDVRVPGFYADITSTAVPEAPPVPKTLIVGLRYDDLLDTGEPIPVRSAGQLGIEYPALKNSPLADAVSALRQNYAGDVDVLHARPAGTPVNAKAYLRVNTRTNRIRSGDVLTFNVYTGSGGPTQVRVVVPDLTDATTVATTVTRRKEIASAIQSAFNQTFAEIGAADTGLYALLGTGDRTTDINLDGTSETVDNTDTIIFYAASFNDARNSTDIANILVNGKILAGAENLSATVTEIDGHVASSGALGNQFSIQLAHDGSRAYDLTAPASEGSTTNGPQLLNGGYFRFAGGTGIIDIETLLDNIREGDYDDLIIPYADAVSTDAANAWVQDRWDWKSQKYGHAWTAVRDTAASLASSSYNRGLSGITILGIDGTLIPDFVIGAAAAGACIDSLRADPGLPLTGIAVSGVANVPGLRDRFSFDENNAILNNGVATFSFSGNTLQIQRAVTNDNSDRWTNTERRYQAVFVARAMRDDLNLYTSRTKLVRDGTTAASTAANVITPSGIHNRLTNFYLVLENAGHVQGSAEFSAGLRVTVNPYDPNRVDMILDPDVADQLFVLAALFNYV